MLKLVSCELTVNACMSCEFCCNTCSQALMLGPGTDTPVGEVSAVNFAVNSPYIAIYTPLMKLQHLQARLLKYMSLANSGDAELAFKNSALSSQVPY